MKTKLIVAALLIAAPALAGPSAPAPTSSYEIGGMKFELVVQAPHLMEAPMQTFGAFTYRDKGDGFSGADVEMDEAFGGAIQQLRKTRGFGKLGESILLNAPAGATGAPKILLVGLGDAPAFRPQDMQRIGAADVRAACGLRLETFSHASDVQDGGVSAPAGDVAANVARGMVDELRTQKLLAEKGLVIPCSVKRISLLSGPKYLKDTQAALEKAAKEIGPK